MTALSLQTRPPAAVPECAPAARERAARVIMGLLGGLVLGAVALNPLHAAARLMPEGFAGLVEKTAPAVVNISTTRKDPWPGDMDRPEFRFPRLPEGSPFKDFFDRYFDMPQAGPEGPRPPPGMRGMGSGFIVASDGTIVTNSHVIGDVSDITVTLDDGSEHQARLIGRDRKTDLALIKIDADRPLPSVSFGDSDKMRVGDWVVAVGNPFGLGGTVTVGVISARNREIEAGPYDDFLQIDAAINRGNSGGPLFNKDGEVIGVNTAIWSPTGGNVGIGFAIPSNLASSVIQQLRETGHVERGWLGVQIQSVTPEIAESLDLGDRRGALVANVTAAGPALAAGVKQGDVILGFAGERIDDARDLARVVARTSADSRVDMTVWRTGKEITLGVTVGRQPEEQHMAAAEPGLPMPSDESRLETVGLRLAAVTPEMRRRFAIEGKLSGVVVTSVKPGSPAAKRGLRPGDVIVAVGQEPVETPDQVVRKVRHAASAGHRAVLFLISRDGRQRFVPVDLAVA
ncbi:MAG: DegQ family serine endoprotease [Kiloniellales bacterium]